MMYNIYVYCIYRFWFVVSFFAGVSIHPRATVACPVTTTLILAVGKCEKKKKNNNNNIRNRQGLLYQDAGNYFGIEPPHVRAADSVTFASSRV